jgi:hypothetical protein
MGELEDALAAAEAGTDGALRGAKAVERELRKAKASAASGRIKEMHAALDGADRLAAQLVSAVRAARAAWLVDELAYFASGRYARELLEMAAAEGVSIVEEDDRLLCYPSVVRVVSGDQAVEIDKKKHRDVRPSHILGLLRAGQTHQPRFKPDAFLESLLAGYELVVAREGGPPGSTARLVDVYNILTLLPGQSRDYTKHEFTRDLYLLDQSGVTKTKSGRELRLPASTLTKGRDVLSTVTKAGQRKLYAGIAFS